jgi:hypothetical protein
VFGAKCGNCANITKKTVKHSSKFCDFFDRITLLGENKNVIIYYECKNIYPLADVTPCECGANVLY